ncbi:hypothetical protein EDS67_17950 [candidate division KSB1 bacterium]|nr:MAG: hypothetical protein EDS67_17950 [candidate division KSB1 bacterium]MBC6949038.1 hypothetical protein [candidate division KSB1 bacterium]MCE7942087.1 hypothetical protein [Chlorobi bacterium CHB1]MDL1874457.1 hypothetical protein [Cytophagia bacterium CHB2]
MNQQQYPRAEDHHKTGLPITSIKAAGFSANFAGHVCGYPTEKEKIHAKPPRPQGAEKTQSFSEQIYCALIASSQTPQA